MKVAVLLYGHLRDFDKCADSLREHLLCKYDCDVFIHTWDVTDHRTLSWHGQRFAPQKVDDTIIGKINVLYNPKELVVEHQSPYDNEEILEPNEYRKFKFSTASCYYLFYTMNKANELRKSYEKKKYIQYDYLVVTRPDVQLRNHFNIEKVISQADMLGLDVGRCRFYATYPSYSGSESAFVINSPNDLFFMGVPSCIDDYIEANKCLTTEFIIDHSVNIVSVYTSKEIAAGIYPVPLSYTLGQDWNFSGYRMSNHFDYRPFGKFKRFCGIVLISILKPVFSLYQGHPWVNYYNK